MILTAFKFLLPFTLIALMLVVPTSNSQSEPTSINRTDTEVSWKE